MYRLHRTYRFGLIPKEQIFERERGIADPIGGLLERDIVAGIEGCAKICFGMDNWQ